jgi:hypothetical protein
MVIYPARTLKSLPDILKAEGTVQFIATQPFALVGTYITITNEIVYED